MFVQSEKLAKELASRGIAANTVAPSAIETDIAGGSVRDDKQVNDFITSVTALGRAGVADDIGPAVASLLTEIIAGSTPSASKSPAACSSEPGQVVQREHEYRN
jgi:NAD(P)-dependent dehydrogenase (short-subunit alcohol dehydrogenase family)